MINSKKYTIGIVSKGEIVEVCIRALSKVELRNAIIGFIIKNDKGQTLLGDNTLNAMPEQELRYIQRGVYKGKVYLYDATTDCRRIYNDSVNSRGKQRKSHYLSLD